MDPGRVVICAAAALALCACASQPRTAPPAPAPEAPVSVSPAPEDEPPPPAIATMAPIPNPPEPARAFGSARTGRAPPSAAAGAASRPPAAAGRSAIAAANLQARATSRSDAFIGGVQVFTYDPGRLYEVWTAPLRVTTLTLAPGEAIVAKAAGDTVRWQIGETSSGEGAARRAHVMIKPLERGLETNLVLTTSQRVYFVQLRSGPPETFNAAVAWDAGAVAAPPAARTTEPPDRPEPLVASAGPLDARFRIETRGRRPVWTPVSVVTDGVRTFLLFPPELSATEAPALFVIGAGGEAQLVNYRQQHGLWVVDRVIEAAELRLGDQRRPAVRIVREGRGP